MTPGRVIARLLAKVAPVEETGCIVSLYSTGSHGYSQIGWHENGQRRMALGHRVAWEAAYGPIPGDLTIDHLCRNRRCVNVEHLRLLPNVVNASLNGNAVKTHCPVGHPYDDENTRRNKRGHRFCRACQRKRNRRLNP